MLSIFLCPLVFIYGDTAKKLRDKLNDGYPKIVKPLVFIKLITGGCTFVWFLYADDNTKLAWVIVFTGFHGTLAFYDGEIVQFSVFALVFVIPFAFVLVTKEMGCSCVGGGDGCKDNEEQEIIFPPANVNPQQQNVQEEPQYVQIHRTTTNKAIDNIMKNWRRKFSFSDKNKTESCGVCLDDFNEQEQIIVLKGGKNHIFHPECLQSWASRNHSGPLGREDFVDIAKKEPENIGNPFQDSHNESSYPQIADEFVSEEPQGPANENNLNPMIQDQNPVNAEHQAQIVLQNQRQRYRIVDNALVLYSSQSAGSSLSEAESISDTSSIVNIESISVEAESSIAPSSNELSLTERE